MHQPTGLCTGIPPSAERSQSDSAQPKNTSQPPAHRASCTSPQDCALGSCRVLSAHRATQHSPKHQPAPRSQSIMHQPTGLCTGILPSAERSQSDSAQPKNTSQPHAHRASCTSPQDCALGSCRVLSAHRATQHSPKHQPAPRSQSIMHKPTGLCTGILPSAERSQSDSAQPKNTSQPPAHRASCTSPQDCVLGSCRVLSAHRATQHTSEHLPKHRSFLVTFLTSEPTAHVSSMTPSTPLCTWHPTSSIPVFPSSVVPLKTPDPPVVAAVTADFA